MGIEVVSLEPGRLEDYLRFFDQVAFTDNPEWAGCYCLFYHVPEGEWEARSAAQNREEAAGLIRAGALSRFPGLRGRPAGGLVQRQPQGALRPAGRREANVWDPGERRPARRWRWSAS